MSAIHLSPAHIAAIVACGHVYREYRPRAGLDTTDETLCKALLADAACLARENARSYSTRYPRDAADPVEVTIETIAAFTAPDAILSPVAFLKALASYDYQTCETDDYETTAAAKIIRGMRNRAIQHLPGYETAAWTIDGVRK